MLEREENDKTVAEPPRATRAADEDHGNALPRGTRLGEFEITGLLGEGGFGIVYLAYDHSLQRTVALKEYMPSSLATRTQGLTVSVRSQRHAETFKAGLKSFINEAHLLARFDHPSLVKVYRFWEANGTAYMVMPYYQGMTLKQALKRSADPPGEDWLKSLLAQLTDALEIIHREQCFHRDIAPDNIIMLEDGRPLLLDFGAARRVIGDMTQALTVILKPGYAPLEQYAEVPHMKQGAWTDIYALAAVVCFAITGKPPTPSVGRTMNDPMVPMVRAGAGRYSEAFLRGIDRALAVKPEDRPQTMAELREILGLGDYDRTVARPTLQPNAGADAQPQRPAPVAGKRSRLPLAAGLVVALVGAGGIALHALWPGPDATLEPGSTVRDSEIANDKTLKPFDPIETIDHIYDGRDREHAVSVVLERGQVRIGKDKLRFRLSSSRGGYAYLLMVGTDRRHFYLLFPNAVDANNRLAPEKGMALPRPGWTMVASGPPGINHFIALVSEHPRDFAEAGLQKVDPFAEFPFEQAQEIARRTPGGGSPFAGKPVCEQGDGCSDAYGAATFTIEEIGDAAAAPASLATQAQPR